MSEIFSLHLSTKIKRHCGRSIAIFLMVMIFFSGFPIDGLMLLSINLAKQANIINGSKEFVTQNAPKVVSQAKALTTSYDFSACAGGNTCDTSTSWWASADDVDIFPFANTAANVNTHTENVDANYTALSASDNSRFASANPGTGDFILNYFEMDITEDPADIAQIDFTFEGYTTSTANFSIYVKDDTTAAINDIAWIRLGTVQSITASTETSFTRSLTGVNFANYIDANGIITWAVSESVAAVVISVDYVKIDVVTNTVEQEGFRWRSDDGDEDAATWLANQDTNIARSTATNTRLRTILNDTSAGNQATTQYQVEYKLSSDTVYRPVQAPSGSIAYSSVGTASGNQTTVLQITAPATVNQGDLLVMGIANKYPTNGPTTPTGWTAVTNYRASGGIGTTGLDTGLIYASVYVREAEGWEDSVVFSVDVPTANGSEGQIVRYTKGNGKKWDLAATNGSDNTGSSNTWSVTGAADPGITAGDMVVVVSAVNTDLYNYSAQAITATGLTMGTQAERVETASTGGDDMELVMSDHAVSSGTASTAPTFTMTSSANSATAPGGASIILRLRQVDAPIQLATSTYITASGDATTAQLTAPTGSPTFIAGRMMDDENPADTIDINDSQYTEMEWCMTATSQATTGDTYQFRITANGLVLTDYTLTPAWSIGTIDVQQIHYRWRNDNGDQTSPDAPTPLFSDGFESNDFSAWDATSTFGSGSQFTGASYKKNGTYGALFHAACTVTDCMDESYAQDNFTFSTTTNKVYLHTWVNISSTIASGYEVAGSKALLAIFSASGEQAWLIIGAGPTGGPSLRLAYQTKSGTNTLTGSEITLTEGSWYQVTLMIDKSGTNPVVEWWLDGTSQASVTDTSSGTSGLANTPSIARFGIVQIVNWETIGDDIFFDDAGVYDSDPISGGTGATWAKAEDTVFTSFPKTTNYRLRLELSNEGSASDGGATHQLQVAQASTCSSGTFAAVPTDSSGAWQIVGSTYLTDGSATTNFTGSLTDESSTFVAGETKDTGNTTGSITLVNNQFTEIEFSLQATTNATDGANYCFRLTNTNTYTVYAQATIAAVPTFTQNYYRWYSDNDGTNPTDVWGNPDLAENATLSPLPSTNNPPSTTDELRLRINITIGTNNLSATSQQFKLQFKAGTDGSCTTGSWTDVGAAQTWEFATSSVTDGTTITTALSNSDVAGQYAKSNPTTTNANSATVGQDIEYDFHIVGTNSTSAKRYSFRVVESDGTVFTAYTYCPTLTTKPVTSDLMRHGKFFSDEAEQGLFW